MLWECDAFVFNTLLSTWAVGPSAVNVIVGLPLLSNLVGVDEYDQHCDQTYERHQHCRAQGGVDVWDEAPKSGHRDFCQCFCFCFFVPLQRIKVQNPMLDIFLKTQLWHLWSSRKLRLFCSTAHYKYVWRSTLKQHSCSHSRIIFKRRFFFFIIFLCKNILPIFIYCGFSALVELALKPHTNLFLMQNEKQVLIIRLLLLSLWRKLFHCQ